MTNARPTEVKASALDQRRDSTAPAHKTDLQQAVADIRKAAADIARLSERIAACNGEVRQ